MFKCHWSRVFPFYYNFNFFFSGGGVGVVVLFTLFAIVATTATNGDGGTANFTQAYNSLTVSDETLGEGNSSFLLDDANSEEDNVTMIAFDEAAAVAAWALPLTTAAKQLLATATQQHHHQQNISGFETNNGTELALYKNLTTWPTKHVASVEGDIILGGLMMVHEREDTIICGPIMAQGGIQALETMLFTLDYINNAGLLPNISIGAHILDDCDKGKCCHFLQKHTHTDRHTIIMMMILYRW